MKNHLKRWLLLLLTMCLVFQQVPAPLYVGAAGMTAVFTDAKEKAGTADETTQKIRRNNDTVQTAGTGQKGNVQMPFGRNRIAVSEKKAEDKSAGSGAAGREGYSDGSKSGTGENDSDESADDSEEEDSGESGTGMTPSDGNPEDRNPDESSGGENPGGGAGDKNPEASSGKEDPEGQNGESSEGKNPGGNKEENRPGTSSSGDQSEMPGGDKKDEEEASGNSRQDSSEEASGEKGAASDSGKDPETAAEDSGVSDGTAGGKNHEMESQPDSGEENTVFDQLLNRNLLRAAARAQNDFNMPKATYETFILQGKNGKGQKIGNSGKVTMLASKKAIQNDITEKHNEYVSFTPHWGADTTASLSTQNGSRNASYYVNDPKKAQHVGGIGLATMTPNIVGGRVYKLTASMKNNLSCTYYNVGRYYDRSSGRSYAIDMKAVVTDFTKKPKGTEDVRNAIADGALDDTGGPLFCFIGGKSVGSIGVLTSFCDAVTLRYSFYIHGTQTPIQVKGFTRFRDVDAQQGIEFSKEADYFYAINAANQYLGYSKGVYQQGNKAYIYSLSSAAVSGNAGSSFYTLFSGSQMTLRYTFAKCSRQDDGGPQNGSDLTKYKVPFDNSDVKDYSTSSSSGYIRFDARQPYLAQPEIQKSVFNGSDIQSEVRTPHTAVSNELSSVNDVFTYKVRTVCPYEDASEHHYASWVVTDQVSPYLNVEQAVIYDGTGSQASDFKIQTQVQGDGSTVVTATASDPAAQSFYEKNWYDLYITVRVKTQAQLDSLGLDFAGRYVNSGARAGRYVIDNHAVLSTGTNYTSNKVETVIPQQIKVRKVNKEGKPVKGVTFGIFVRPDADIHKEEPLMTAVTGDDGVAHFKAASFFDLSGKAGPYYVREISRGEFENVYLLDETWKYTFSSDKGNPVIYGEERDKRVSTLEDVAKILKKYTVRVRKKNKETSDFLKGAVFALYQWSAAGKSYMKVCDLEEATDEEGQIYYRNPEDITATEDNLGRFMVKEEQAPYGCYNAGMSWTFATTDAYVQDEKNIEFLYTSENGRERMQKGELIYHNNLQKGILKIVKTDDEGALVKGALFEIKAAEDIYAPWQYKEDGTADPNQEPLVPKGMVCGYLTTDENGSAVSNPLYIGRYHITETGGAPDHVPSGEVYEVTFAYPEKDDVPVVEETVQAGNVIMRPSLAVAKLAERTRNPEGGEVEFDTGTGRYTQEKVPGIYRGKETIRYRITVTNTGNTDLYHVRVYDSMDEPNAAGQKLSDYVDKDRASFVVPAAGSYETKKGSKITVSVSEEDRRMVLLSRLPVGDSVELYFEVPVLDSAANVYQLINKVKVTASYDNNEERPGQHLIPVNTEDLVDEEGNPLTEDEDQIHIPGTPDTSVVKIADRTTGALVTDGELNGTKVPGLYYDGDTVRFDIHIKNTGTANLKNILVTDVMSEDLKQVIRENTAGFRLDSEAGPAEDESTEDEPSKNESTENESSKNESTENEPSKNESTENKPAENDPTEDKRAAELTENEPAKDERPSEDKGKKEDKNASEVTLLTGQGEYVSARQIDAARIILCENVDDVTGKGSLRPGDTIVLHFYAEVKKDAANFYDLMNKVIVNASYFTGEEDMPVPEKSDTDLIELPGVPEAKIAKLADRTTGAVLIDGRYQNEKITGSYDNGNEIVYTITVTNSGTADLYDLKVRDVMEEKLLSALDKDSIRFQDGRYTTMKGDSIETTAKNENILLMDHLKAGDSVNLLLRATVSQQAGDLFNLENKVYVTGHYRKGNEQYQQEYEKEAEAAGHSYVLEYHANNGTDEKTPDSETPAHEGETVHINGNPFTKENYEFLGWNTKADGTGQDYAPGAEYTMPAQDVHLYARWGSKGSILKKNYTYALIYHSNNPLSQSRPDSETRCFAGTAVLLDENSFVYDGYHFVGWSMTPDDREELLQPGDSCRMPKKDLHLYAQWEKDAKVSLTYHSGIPGQEQTKTDFQTPCAKGTEITVKQCEFEREDSVFVGWSREQEASKAEFYPQDTILLDRDTDLYAVWEKEKDGEEEFRYRLTYHGNNETNDSFVDFGTPCSAGTAVVLSNNLFVYDGYVFTEWNTKADGTGTSWNISDTFMMPDRNVHLYAQWKKTEKHTLTYVSNYPNRKEGEPHEERIDSETPCPEQTIIRIDGCSFQCDGHRFLGWSLTPDGSSELITPEVQYTISTDTVLYAIWTDDCEEYTLMYSSNTEGAVWEAAPDSPSPAGTPQTIIANPFSNKEAAFVGWSSDEKATANSENLLKPGQRFEQPARNTVLYAVWEEAGSHKVYYDGNGGTSTSSEAEADGRLLDEETPCVSNTGIRINPSSFVREGFRFLGWSTEKLAPLKAEQQKQSSNEEKMTWEQAMEQADIIYPGCAYTVSDSDTVFYAVWEELPKSSFDGDSPSYDGDELSESPYTPIPVTELMKDQDHVNIPGEPDLRVAKKADKTKGITLKKGRYQGKRKPGTYYEGDRVTYKITVSNYGTATVNQIKIKEIPSAAWKKALEPEGFTASVGEVLETAKGNLIRVKNKTDNTLILDTLKPNDSVTVTFEAVVTAKQVSKDTLKNTVKVTGKKYDGTSVAETEYTKDSDTIQIAAEKQPSSSVSDSVPKTGDTTPIYPLIFIGILSLTIAAAILVIQRRQKHDR